MDISKIIEDMTLPEKLAQMTQLLGDYYVSDYDSKLMGLSYGFDMDEKLVWNVGSVLGLMGAKECKHAQIEFLKRNRHQIPLMFMQDVIHGYRTIFPSVLGLACSWNPELIVETASIAAKEAAVSGVHVTFSPMADLVRDPRWGRVVESAGEDPYLNALYARAFVRGYQGDNVGEQFKLASCVKHFIGYGACEAGRDYNTTEIGEYSLRGQYLPAFKAAIEQDCKIVMTAFNALDGVPCTGNRRLLRETLREEMGFDGIIISDCTSVYELIPHGFAEHEAEACEKSLTAGVDIEMVSTTYYQNGEKNLKEDKITMKQIDAAVMRILMLKKELGLFQNPLKDIDEQREKELHLCSAHRTAARKAARESVVLLKNEGETLPLSTKYKKIALLGPYGDSKNLLDVWKCAGQEEEAVSIYEGLNQKQNVTAMKGCGIYDGTLEERQQAVALAKDSDIILLALGEHPEMSAEAGSRGHITLPEVQMKLAEELFALGKPVVVVLISGRPLELGIIAERASAILAAWFPGTEGGNAIAELLVGEESPLARLTMSFPVSVGQIPVYYNHLPTGRPKGAEENGERFVSRYIDLPNAPLYPFGYGLTYTEFQYGKIELSSNILDKSTGIIARISIKNIGKRSGVETVQLYLQDLAGSRSRPVLELKGFQRVCLEPAEERQLEFKITDEMVKFNTLENGFASENGRFKVYIGKNALEHEHAVFEKL